ncbi:hypothetical protein KGF56_001648 [Candida oxycetoniae]|uniref:Uncharacterized protein n=1 Tax=Candida oxycetoniae TaxID=497107 RepID=A0AAI9SZF3_9ASCO|nr:uncharacterized protein KGF56_001648 [Candida oxycetoniae]KAI3405630.2 hypothetical protein KGF56_001648 [Candida oxycetoniae]
MKIANSFAFAILFLLVPIFAGLVGDKSDAFEASQTLSSTTLVKDSLFSTIIPRNGASTISADSLFNSSTSYFTGNASSSPSLSLYLNGTESTVVVSSSYVTHTSDYSTTIVTTTTCDEAACNEIIYTTFCPLSSTETTVYTATITGDDITAATNTNEDSALESVSLSTLNVFATLVNTKTVATTTNVPHISCGKYGCELTQIATGVTTYMVNVTVDNVVQFSPYTTFCPLSSVESVAPASATVITASSCECVLSTYTAGVDVFTVLTTIEGSVQTALATAFYPLTDTTEAVSLVSTTTTKPFVPVNNDVPLSDIVATTSCSDNKCDTFTNLTKVITIGTVTVTEGGETNTNYLVSSEPSTSSTQSATTTTRANTQIMNSSSRSDKELTDSTDSSLSSKTSLGIPPFSILLPTTTPSSGTVLSEAFTSSSPSPSSSLITTYPTSIGEPVHSRASSTSLEELVTTYVTYTAETRIKITITSCNHNACSSSQITTGVTAITTTISNVEVVYTTYCPLSSTQTIVLTADHTDSSAITKSTSEVTSTIESSLISSETPASSSGSSTVNVSSTRESKVSLLSLTEETEGHLSTSYITSTAESIEIITTTYCDIHGCTESKVTTTGVSTFTTSSLSSHTLSTTSIPLTSSAVSIFSVSTSADTTYSSGPQTSSKIIINTLPSISPISSETISTLSSLFTSSVPLSSSSSPHVASTTHTTSSLEYSTSLPSSYILDTSITFSNSFTSSLTTHSSSETSIFSGSSSGTDNEYVTEWSTSMVTCSDEKCSTTAKSVASTCSDSDDNSVVYVQVTSMVTSTAQHTAVVTVTSCSDEKCTSQTSTCSDSDDNSVVYVQVTSMVTSTAQHTAVVTVTSCSDEKCTPQTLNVKVADVALPDLNTESALSLSSSKDKEDEKVYKSETSSTHTENTMALNKRQMPLDYPTTSTTTTSKAIPTLLETIVSTESQGLESIVESTVESPVEPPVESTEPPIESTVKPLVEPPVSQGFEHSTSKNGHRGGKATAFAAWRKLKATTSSYVALEKTHENSNEAKSIENGGESDEKIIENGVDGELFVLHTASRILEVWDWDNQELDPDRDTLHLKFQVQFSRDCNIRCFKILQKKTRVNSSGAGGGAGGSTSTSNSKSSTSTSNSVHFMVAITSNQTCANIEVLELEPGSVTQTSSLQLGYTSEHYKLLVSETFACVGTSDGYIHIFHISQQLKLEMGIQDSKTSTIRKHHRQYSKINTHLEDGYVAFQSSKSDGLPIFDLVDNWLVYSPVQAEYRYLKTVNQSDQDDHYHRQRNLSDRLDPVIVNYNQEVTPDKISIYTPMKLPASAPLYNKILETLSKTAVDGLLKLSEFSSAKYKDYMANNLELNKISKSVGKSLYESLQKGSEIMKPSDNQVLTILDLKNDKFLGTFKAPGGVSCVSMSPYDLQLVTVNYRGDSLYMWDLFRLPLDVSLVGKFTRGQTSAIIKDIYWFNTEEWGGSHLGFGCVSKSTGSVHWFCLNYSKDGNSSKARRKLSSRKYNKSNSKRVLNSWTLSSFGAEKFVNVSTTQLGVVDKNGLLKLVDTLSGDNFYEYKIPASAVEEFESPEIVSNANVDKTLKKKEKKKRKEEEEEEKEEEEEEAEEEAEVVMTKVVNPISQAEIETCPPFLNFINRENIEFATYKYRKEDFYEFGKEIHTETIDFKKSKGNKLLVKHSNAKSTPNDKEEQLPNLYQLHIDQEDNDEDETLL